MPLVIPPWQDMPTNVPSPGIPTPHWALPSPSHRPPTSFLGTDFLLDLFSLLIVWEPDPCSSVQMSTFSRHLSGALSLSLTRWQFSPHCSKSWHLRFFLRSLPACLWLSRQHVVGNSYPAHTHRFLKMCLFQIMLPFSKC